MGKAGDAWQLSVDYLNDSKSAGHEKRQCLEDCHWRFGHAESLWKNSAKTAEWWSEGTPHVSESEHYWESLNWIRLAL